MILIATFPSGEINIPYAGSRTTILMKIIQTYNVNKYQLGFIQLCKSVQHKTKFKLITVNRIYKVAHSTLLFLGSILFHLAN